MTLQPRPKVVAAAGGTTGTVVLAFALRLLGVDVDAIPAEVLIAGTGALATGAAYLRRDGLAGAWDLLVYGDRTRPDR